MMVIPVNYSHVLADSGHANPPDESGDEQFDDGDLSTFAGFDEIEVRITTWALVKAHLLSDSICS